MSITSSATSSTDVLAFPEKVGNLPDWVRDPFCRFVRLRQRNWPAKTVKRHTSQLCCRMIRMIQFLRERGGWQEWPQLSPRLIEEYIDDKLRYGWAAATINWDLIHFRSFCYFAIEEGYPVPHTVTRMKDLAIPQRLPRPLPDEQVRRLEQCIQETIAQAKSKYQRQLAIRDLAFFYLMWHCGLRVGEVSELLVSDVDLRGKKIFIHDSKERKDRMLYISPTTATALQHHLEARKRQDAAYVFASQHRALTPRGIRRRLKKYGQECGIPITPHRLRHTFASQMLAAGMSVTSLQRYLGHEDLDTTMIYAQVSDPMLQRDYYRGAATFDPASADLARAILAFSEREELRQLIAELKDSELDSVHRQEILEQMETVLDASD